MGLQSNMRKIFEMYMNNNQEYQNISNINKEAMRKYDFNNTEIVRNVI
jgi:hypothetical protein